MAQKDEEALGEPWALAEQRVKARTAQLLVLNGGLFFVGWMVGQTAEQEIWLRHYNGGALSTLVAVARRHRDSSSVWTKPTCNGSGLGAA